MSYFSVDFPFCLTRPFKTSYPDWVLRYKREGTAIHKIGGNFYLYEVRSVWDKALGRARKVTKGYLGKITPEGLKEPGYRSFRPTTSKEYGASFFLLETNREIIEGLKKHFPERWKELFVLSVFRLMYRAPLKHMEVHYQDSWISEVISEASLSKYTLHQILETIGRNRGAIVGFFRDLYCREERLLIDLTHVFSFSEGIGMAEEGFNRELDFSPQVNLLFIFSFDRKLPLFYRVLPGSVRDVSSLKSTVVESGITDAVIIGDKGFYSRKNVKLLEEEGLRYILPLKRDNSLINYKILKMKGKDRFDGHFKFGNKRYIWYYRCSEEPLVYVFLDENLKIREEEDYLDRIETHPELGYTMEKFHKKEHTFETIALITNLKGFPAEKVYYYFKSRTEIEQVIDTFKNLLSADRTYMRSDYSMEGWMCINYLSLLYYYKIYQLLVERNLLRRYCPSDVCYI